MTLRAVVILLLLAGPLPALEPDQIAILAVRESPQSQELARYYAAQRKVPDEQIFLIDVTPGKPLSRSEWDGSVRPAIREWLREQKLEDRIRCVVTTWDVPLKIGRADGAAERTAFLEQRRTDALARLKQVPAELRSLLPAEDTDPPAGKEFAGDAPLKEIATALEGELKAAFRRNRGKDEAVASADIEQKLRAVLGTSFGLNSLRQMPDATAASDAERTAGQQQKAGRWTGLREGILALSGLPESVSRDRKILQLLHRSDGFVGEVAWIDQQLQLLKRNETYSSFDSELSLLHWPAYPLMRWMPNSLHHQLAGRDAESSPPVLMVARLEAPTFELAKELINAAIAIEQEGLKGKVYLDARGLAAPKNARSRGSYGQYDQSLRKLAELLEKQTDLSVTLDNNPALFQPGDCPEAVIYSGWYSLARYVDAFTWKRGAIAYHIASSEAVTLRDSKSNVWCKRMLEEGVCATLGPVHEPYLAAFPLPEEFFPLLMTGKLTLAETYYRTKPFNSWVMVLVGDPLYRPFAKHPPLDADALPPTLKQLIESPQAAPGIPESAPESK